MTRNQTVLRALHDRLNVGVLCASAGLSVLLASWTLFLLGVALFGSLVVWDASRGRRHLLTSVPRLPEGSSFNHIGVRGAMDGIAESQRERMNAIEACPDEALLVLGSVLRTAALAEAAALRIARRTDRLHAYLATKDLPCMRATMGSAQQAARGARSPGERDSYDAAARAYELALETLGGIELTMRTGLARLENLRATLAVIPPRIMKWQAASEALTDLSTAHLSGDILAATSEIAEAEEHLCALSRAEAEPPYEHARIEAPPLPPSRSLRVDAASGEPLSAAEHEVEELALEGIRRHLQV